MTDTTSSAPEPGEGQPKAGQSGAAQPGAAQPEPEKSPSSFDASELYSDMVAYGKELLDRVSDRAAESTPKIREKGYDADQWVADVEWFWENVKNDAVRAAKYWRERFPGA